MGLARRGERHAIHAAGVRAAGAPSLRPGSRSPARPAASGELERQQVLEQGSGESLAQERPRPQHEQAAAALADEAPRRLELGARELMRLDVGEHERVVAEERVARRGVAGGQAVAARLRRLHVERIGTLLVLALAHHRVDFETGIGRPRTLQEAVLESRRALDEQDAAGARRRLHEDAAGVVLGNELAGEQGHLDGVDRRCALAGRDLEHFAHRRALGGGGDALDVDRTPVLEQAQLDRRAPQPVADRRHRQVDARVVEDRLGDGDAEHLAILARHRCADADGEDRRAHPRPRAPRRARVTAVRHQDDARDRPAAVALAHGGERPGDIAAARRGRQRCGRHRGNAIAEAEHLDLKLRAERRQQTLGDDPPRAIRLRAWPSASSMLMLRDVSTRTATTASRASPSTARATGRSRNRTSARSVTKRSVTRIQRREGDSVRRL